MAKIYVWPTTVWESGDVAGIGVAEDGTQLSGHMSSNEAWFQHDMGITSNRKHDKYAEHYPDGYELVYISIAEIEGGDIQKNQEFEAWYEQQARQQAGGE